uniref:Packaging subunit 1 n=1 Tax=Elephant endotheliotropic herpesvirus 1A TaxID=759753 RepID=A0A866VTF6_ELHV1|nr:packaging subunit 1 [Elephant endotheliotropic herpesvirus 1A]QOE74727.1 packaging subunit 1 [Elephant endotheliotropic herpesvirus 1A]QOE74847.1 packaging subunit 1 [Elephant endotheliotropic herpesvirus 1A]QOE75084.1 packaging subunit 1 [Elephant endotheliotropic herpesvirus 1A]WES72517.1 packaging subunit 1 [Elephantid betaherpesvirus 1]
MEIHLFNEIGKVTDGPFMVHVALSTYRFDLGQIDMLFIRSVFLHNKHISCWTRIPFNIRNVDVDLHRYFSFKPKRKNERTIILARPVVFFSLPLLSPGIDNNKLAVEAMCICRFVNTNGAEFFDLEFMYEDILREFPDVGDECIKEDDHVDDFFTLGACSSATVGTVQNSTGQDHRSPVNDNNEHTITPGPLEPPSVVRGVDSNSGNGLNNMTPGKCNGYPTGKHVWKAIDIYRLQPLHTPSDNVYRVLYDKSSFLKPRISQPPYDGLASCFFLRHEIYRFMRVIGTEIIDKFFDVMNSEDGILFQKFLCHVPMNALDISIPEMVYLSQNVWTSHVDPRSCIIKGVVAHLFKNPRRPCFVGSLTENEYWVDVIDIRQNRIYYGQKIKLAVDQETNLLTCNDKSRRYEQRAGLSVLYINTDLCCIWSFTGGFAVEFRLTLEDIGNVDLIRAVFGAPSTLFE